MADIRTFGRILDGEHVLSEATGRRSREEVTLKASATNPIVAGTVLGKVTGTGHYAIHDPAAGDGTEAAAGVLFIGKRKSASTQKGVIHCRSCELNGKKLTYLAGMSAPDKALAIADLLALGVIVRP